MLQLTIFFLALVLIYVVKCVVVMRSSEELAANSSSISLIHAEEAFEQAALAQERDAQRAREAQVAPYVAHGGMRRRVA